MVNFAFSMMLAITAVLSVPNAAALPVDDSSAAGSPVVKMIRSSPNNANKALAGLENRSVSRADVTCYSEPDCTGDAIPKSMSFTTASPCITVANCQCMVVRTLDNAHIAYWNHMRCNGNKSILNGCYTNGTVTQVTRGTNSIGFHPGCSGD